MKVHFGFTFFVWNCLFFDFLFLIPTSFGFILIILILIIRMCVIFFLCSVWKEPCKRTKKKICNISKNETKQRKKRKKKKVTFEMKMLEIGQGKKIENDWNELNVVYTKLNRLACRRNAQDNISFAQELLFLYYQ